MISTRTRRGSLAALAVAGTLALAGCGSLTESADSDSGADAGIDQLKIIVPADPGGGWDATGRAMQGVLQDNDLVGNAQVVNVGGAGGTIGLAQLANEREENTLMVMGLVMVGAVETNDAEATLEDVTPVAELTEEPLIVVAPADSPYESVSDLVADQADRGQGVSVAGGSAGGADHILAGLLLQDAGVDPGGLNYIPYSGGGESLAALLGSKVDAGISGVAEYAPQVESGELKALGVSGAERSELLPDVPTLAEQGIDVELTNWRGVVAPGSIDDSKADELTQLVTDMHGTEDWTTALEENAWADAFVTGDEFGTFLDSEVTRVQQVLRDIGLVE
ncbi:Bug family tripartite tricarboxylate transporter substrate binding protein [Nocardioides coralli]|uniref:Bug family tripartite tricarboxylate transporter substrate binding protein n=1 Tax=Nocardioides coralli TaxID=2872154 RepID=UPI001CA438EC|nr:tripartite tricarboxylate transporter substrate-binding protein [Nocardioides coralli]QZY29498.1 tripartite tricarboxylate transporter substrate binding protein [Nocardioides coralli]